MKKRMAIALALIALSVCRLETVYNGQPAWQLWGNPTYVTYDPDQHVWVNDNPSRETIFRVMDLMDGVQRRTLPEEVPEEQELRFTFNPSLLWRSDHDGHVRAALLGVALLPQERQRRRLVLVNVEEAINRLDCDTTQYRLWPHLGLLYVGTVADEEGWEVVLHDELIQGYVDLEQIVRPGDVVGLSLVVTGMERGVELARQAKRLGAACVIAGNDSAIFRANRILALPDRPIDAVFTTNSLGAIREFLRLAGTVALNQLEIPGVAVVPAGLDRSNEEQVLRAERDARLQLKRSSQARREDTFIVPRLDLFGADYWRTVWSNYRTVLGEKHRCPAEVRNGLALLAQGCTRTALTSACTYCTIAEVANIELPGDDYLVKTLETYRSFGIDYVYNATDSAYVMKGLVRQLRRLGAHFQEGLTIYGRAWGLAHHPELLEEWLALTGGRLLVNSGFDSGDEAILARGVLKASQAGSRLEENRQAVRYVAAAGVNLHYSLIFGSPGETRESCQRTIEFFEWSAAMLGPRLDQCETDLYWLNHGSPASRVFRDYQYAVSLAALAGKEISRETWERDFHQHRDTLVVPMSSQEAWYRHFTSISVEEAQGYISYVAARMARHEGAAPGRRATAFKPPGEPV